MRVKRRIILLVILTLLTLFSVCTYSGNVDNPVVDLFSHFLVQYVVAFLLISIFCIIKRDFLLSLISLVLFLINLFFTLNFNLGSAHASLGHYNVLRLYSANIHYGNTDLTRLMNDIKTKRPDLVVLIEVRQRHIDELTPVIREYGYILKDPKIDASNMGVVFLSSYPIVDYDIINLSDCGNSVIRARLKINGKDIIFYGVHLPRIGPDRNFQVRQRIFIRLASEIAKESLPVIVAGDFNATPYSPIFRKFVDISKLVDSSKDYGWLPTWPTFFPPLWIPIDHILTSSDVHIINIERGSFIFSDHYPLVVSFSIK